MGRRVNMDKLLAKIAEATKMDVDELKEKRQQSGMHSYEENVMEMQSVISYYRTRIEPKPPEKQKGESDLDFAFRKVEFDKAYHQWRFRVCESCKMDFAYAYPFEGVKFCSLDCLDAELRKIGLRVTPGRDLKKRWGTQYPGSGIPAIVPSSALESLGQLYGPSYESHDVRGRESHPKLHQETDQP